MAVTLTFTAETTQAAAATQKYFNDLQAQLQKNTVAARKLGESFDDIALHKIRESSALLKESFHQLESSILLLGGTRFPHLAEGIISVRTSMGLVRTATMLTGASLAAVGTTAAAVAIVLASFGIPAFREYKARMEEAATAAALLASTQELIARNTTILSTALQKRLISKEDADYIEKLLKLNNPQSLRAAQDEMRRLGISPAQLEAAEKLNALTKTSRLSALGEGTEAEAARALDAYKTKLQDIDDLLAKNPALKDQAEAGRAAAKDEYNQRLASLRKQTIKDNEVHALKALDDQIAQYELDNADKVGGKAQAEFEMRFDEYRRLRDEKIITEEQYNDYLDAARRKRQQEQQTEAEVIARNQERQRQALGRDIESDFRLTSAQRFAALQRSGFRPEGPNPASLLENSEAMMTKLRELNNLAQTIPAAFEESFNSAIHSISDGITGLIMGTKTWAQAWREVGSSILQNVIQAIIEMGVRWVATKLFMATAGKAIEAASLAANAVIAKGFASQWATPAALAAVSSYGAAGAAGAASLATTVAAAQAIAVARERGGTAEAGQLYMTGERGRELFVPESDGYIFNAQQTRQILGGRGDGRGGQPVNVKNHIHIWTDKQQMDNWLKQSTDAHQFIVDLVGQNAWQFSR